MNQRQWNDSVINLNKRERERERERERQRERQREREEAGEMVIMKLFLATFFVEHNHWDLMANECFNACLDI